MSYSNSSYFIGLPYSETFGRFAPDSSIPSECKRSIFVTDKISSIYYHAPAKGTVRGGILGVAGLNTHELMPDKAIEKLTDAGISITWLTLPLIKKQNPIVSLYAHLIEEFFTSPHSPAKFLVPSNVPQIVLTHSTGGQMYARMMLDESLRNKVEANRDGAIYVTPFLGARVPRGLRVIYRKYMDMRPDLSPNDRRIASAYISVCDWLDPHSEPHTSLDTACRHIRALEEHGHHLMELFNRAAHEGKVLSRKPAIVIVGKKDRFACPQVSQAFADIIRAKIEPAEEGFHNPLKSHPHLVDTIIALIESAIAERLRESMKTTYVPSIPPPAIKEHDAHDWQKAMIDLRHRAGLALKRGAGFLNSAAGLF